MKKLILHIDYDTFFASVEQQANPFLRNRPIVVSGSSLTRGVVCTKSLEAKKFGIKTGMPLFRAKSLCPHLIHIRGDSTKYIYIQKKSLEIFNKYTDLVEPFSIDEAFLDVTKTIKFFGTPQNLIKRIKKDVRDSFGKHITCSIGIGPNKLIAKLVSDINKPNGHFIVTNKNIDYVLAKTPLRNFCGIGYRLEQRLNDLGIHTVTQLQDADSKELHKYFGNVSSKFLKDLSYGMDNTNVRSIEYIQPVKSISHQHTLSKNTKDHRIIKANLLKLTEMVTRRLRKKSMLGKTIYMGIRDAERRYHGTRKTLHMHTCATAVVYETVETMFDALNWAEEIRLVSIGISNLVPGGQTTMPLFLQDQKTQLLNQAVDEINDKWGSYTVISATTLRADKTKGKISSFLKHV